MAVLRTISELLRRKKSSPFEDHIPEPLSKVLEEARRQAMQPLARSTRVASRSRPLLPQ